VNTLAALAAMASGEPASSELVDRYYTLCIPFYREFLGDHWHTGLYPAQGPIGPADQLRMELLVARSAGIAAGSRVLDVGCGVGGTACRLARALGAQVRGLTPNAAQLELAQARAARLGLQEQVGFDPGWAHALPYEAGSFDAVLFFESACHFPDRAAFFAEAFRVLRPGGCLSGQDWLAGEGAEPSLRWSWCARVESAWAIPALGTTGEYAALMRQAGFEVELARDMREEMPLLRGFLADEAARAAVTEEARGADDPMRRQIMEALVVLGEAAELGAFTVGRFVARKPG
jgi:cyclopropane fatty-acyl-phospholipid synthase-like methyltransferase